MKEAIKIALAVALLGILAADLGTRISENFHHDRPRIEINQEAKRPPGNQSAPHNYSRPLAPQITTNGDAKPDGNEAEQEGTEFLPLMFGMKLKVTDTLIAAFTFCLAISTFLLWWETKTVALGTADAINLARQEFIATHRPKIKIWTVRPSLAGVTPNNEYPVKITFLNYGESAAHINSVGIRVFRGNGPWTRGAREIQFIIDALNTTLKGGESYVIFSTETYDSHKNDMVVSSQLGSFHETTYCVGYISYRASGDDFDRRTGFCRQWDTVRQTWNRVTNEELEYEH